MGFHTQSEAIYKVLPGLQILCLLIKEIWVFLFMNICVWRHLCYPINPENKFSMCNTSIIAVWWDVLRFSALNSSWVFTTLLVFQKEWCFTSMALCGMFMITAKCISHILHNSMGQDLQRPTLHRICQNCTGYSKRMCKYLCLCLSMSWKNVFMSFHLISVIFFIWN